MNHTFVDSIFSEFLFTVIFSPSIPIIYDSVGNYLDYLNYDII